MRRDQLIETILEGMGYTPDAIRALSAIGLERNTDVRDATNIASVLVERGIVKLTTR